MYSWARHVHALRDTAELPLILLTCLGTAGETDMSDVDFAVRLTKPVKTSQLYNALVAAVAGSQPSGKEPPQQDGDRPPRLCGSCWQKGKRSLPPLKRYRMTLSSWMWRCLS